MQRVFVYGTLKQGFRNQHWNLGQRLPGRFLSVERYPLLVLGPACLPWLSEEPGQGERVWGEVYVADAAALARMDELEQLDRPDWYRRGELVVEAEDGALLTALVYFGSPLRAARETVHAGPVAEYTLELAARFAHEAGAVGDAREDERRLGAGEGAGEGAG